jgi:hypothetical protein
MKPTGEKATNTREMKHKVSRVSYLSSRVRTRGFGVRTRVTKRAKKKKKTHAYDQQSWMIELLTL